MNEFGEKYYDLIEKYREETLLKREEIMPDYFCYRDDFPEPLLLETIRLSEEKAKYVSKKNQRGIVRSQKDIEANVFKGVIAETVAQIYLTKMCNLSESSVKRYDLERKNFEYNPYQEYDVGIFKDDCFLHEIGVKSSKIVRDEFEDFLNKQHCIIGKYRFNGRKEDHNSAYYLGIIIVYEKRYDMKNFVDDYLKGDVHTYIVSGASYSEMVGKYCTKDIKMNQKGTKYNLGLRSMYAGDADDCREKLSKFLNSTIIDYEYSRLLVERQTETVMAYVMQFDKYHIYHTNRNCKYIKDRNVQIFDSENDAIANGYYSKCKYCSEQDGGETSGI